MASRGYPSKESKRDNLEEEEDDEEEEEIFSVSGGQLGSLHRGAQSSRFGAVDEAIELSIDAAKDDNDRDDDAVGGSNDNPTDVSHPPSSYQAEAPAPSTHDEAAERAMDNLLSAVGVGKQQALMLVLFGLGMVHASVQLGFVGVLMPDMARDLCLSDASTGWLRGSVFVGVVFTSVLWGCGGDLVSRRTCLVVCLAIAGLSMACAACFAVSRSTLLAFLIIGSLSTGGVIAIPFTVMVEFVPRRAAKQMVCALLAFTILGTILVPVVATAFVSSFNALVDAGAVVPRVFANWRIFCLVLSQLPVPSAILVPVYVPRSPYLLLEKRQWAETIRVLAKMYSYNHGEACVEGFKDRANGLYRLKRQTKDRQAPAPSTRLQSCVKVVYQGVNNITAVLDRSTLVIATSAFLLAFGFSSWTLWLTDFITVEGLRYNATVIANVTFSDDTITTSLVGRTFLHATFDNVSFLDLHLRDVSFVDCAFTRCTFEDVTSEAIAFNRSLFADTAFRRTDFQPRQFTGGVGGPVNSTGRADGAGCSVDVPFASVRAYWTIALGQSGGLVGLVLSIFITRLIETWRLFMCGALVTVVAILFAFLPLTGWTASGLLFVIQLGGFAAWSALIVQAALSFPTRQRATGICFVLTVATLGGLLGFVVVVTLPQTIDVVVTAVAVIASAVCSYFWERLPEWK